MTNTYNIAGADGNVMVPVLTETGSLMAYVLYPDPTGILQELYSCMTIPRPFSDNSLTTPRQFNINSGSTLYRALYYKNAFGCTGQPIIHSFKTKKMAKSTTTGGISADRIKNDSAFERTQENMAEFMNGLPPVREQLPVVTAAYNRSLLHLLPFSPVNALVCLKPGMHV